MEGDLYFKLKGHVGHKIECASYSDYENIAIECIQCNEVIVDDNRPEIEE